MENQSTFYRFEKKYLLNQFTYRRLKSLLAGRMEQDAYGRYTITSVYFDTDTYDIIRTSVQKPPFKEKLRLRWYGTSAPRDSIFLELKRKYRGKVYKRRIPIQAAGADRLLHAEHTPLAQGQIAREVDWFITRHHPMPKLVLSYDREALACRNVEGLRVTFDHNIRWRDRDFELQHGSYGTPLLDDDKVLMEIKAYGNLPIWLSNLLAAEKIYPSSFSKYGAWYERVHLQKGETQYVG